MGTTPRYHILFPPFARVQVRRGKSSLNSVDAESILDGPPTVNNSGEGWHSVLSRRRRR